MEIITDKMGLKFYSKLPETFVQASPGDFFLEEILRDPEDNILGSQLTPKTKTAYLVQSFHDGKYYPHRVNPSFDPNNLWPWFMANKVFIHNPDLVKQS